MRGARIVFAAALVALGLVPTTFAIAGPLPSSCAFANGELTIEEHFSSGRARIYVWQDTDGNVWAIAGIDGALPNAGTFCSGSPTVSSVESIVVRAGSTSGNLIIWMTRSQIDVEPVPPFGEGPPADWGTITWDVRLGADRREKDTLDVYSTWATQGLDLTAGDAGIDLNGDGRLDVTYSSSLVKIGVVVDPKVAGLRNVISMAGGGGTGGPVKIRTVIGVGGTPGEPLSTNTLTGGIARDLIVGGAGEDRIVGGAGRDGLDGRDGDDRINGGAGNDGIQGGRGHDVCSGGPGRDQVNCEVTHEVGEASWAKNQQR